MWAEMCSPVLIRSQSFSETELGISLPPYQRLEGAGVGCFFSSRFIRFR